MEWTVLERTLYLQSSEVTPIEPRHLINEHKARKDPKREYVRLLRIRRRVLHLRRNKQISAYLCLHFGLETERFSFTKIRQLRIIRPFTGAYFLTLGNQYIIRFEVPVAYAFRMQIQNTPHSVLKNSQLVKERRLWIIVEELSVVAF